MIEICRLEARVTSLNGTVLSVWVYSYRTQLLGLAHDAACVNKQPMGPKKIPGGCPGLFKHTKIRNLLFAPLLQRFGAFCKAAGRCGCVFICGGFF